VGEKLKAEYARARGKSNAFNWESFGLLKFDTMFFLVEKGLKL